LEAIKEEVKRETPCQLNRYNEGEKKAGYGVNQVDGKSFGGIIKDVHVQTGNRG